VGADSGLAEDGILIQDGYLALPEVRALADCARARQARGEFAAARIGAADNLERREEIRGDFTCWIAEPLCPAERELLDGMEQLRLRLNRDAFLGLLDLELHYARYPRGTAYARHVDQPIHRSQRRLSLVLYLNEDWDPSAGGELRLYNAQDGHRDIEPVAGRLVCFLTQGREHEVMTARRERLSVTGWFRARD
jgi:SM-20-related protein